MRLCQVQHTFAGTGVAIEIMIWNFEVTRTMLPGVKLPLFSMFPNNSTGGGPCLMNVVESAVGGYLLGSLLLSLLDQGSG
jgi:hypothetical protein